MRPSLAGLLSAAWIALACASAEIHDPAVERPSFLVIVADDLGYSDLGAYGSEIPTPNLDALAISGLRATDFYVSCRGAPSRAMLLTGVDNHVAGFGVSDGRRPEAVQKGQPGYEGRLSEGVVTVASLLRDAGYHTSMAGKWALGDEPGNLPRARGFERSFVLHDTAASHWQDMRSAVPRRERARYTRNGADVESLPAGYFSTRFFTDFVLESIAEARAAGRPFFAYLSFQAPHGPLADDERVSFSGRYDEGFDAIRNARLLRMKTLGLLDQSVQPYPGIPTVPSWSDLSEERRRRQARKMELYAGMVAGIDFHVGRLLEVLRTSGGLDDTVVVFLSDSGPEPRNRGPSGMDPRDLDWYAEQFPKRGMEHWGDPGSFVEVGPAWAEVSSVPFRLFKSTLAEGGIRSPLIISGPGIAGADRRGRPRIARDVLHVTDLTPTFLELAGVAHPPSHRGRAVAPLEGRSLVGYLRGSAPGPHDWQGFAYADMGAIRKDRWKLVRMPRPFGVGRWRLYRLDHDPAERFDRAAARPKRAKELAALWERYAQANGVILPEEAPQKPSPSER